MNSCLCPSGTHDALQSTPLTWCWSYNKETLIELLLTEINDCRMTTNYLLPCLELLVRSKMEDIGWKRGKMDITLRVDINSTIIHHILSNILFINHHQYRTSMPFSFLILLAISLPFSLIWFPPELITFLRKSKYLSDGSCIYHNIYTPSSVILFPKSYSLSSVENLWNFSAPSSI